MSQSWTPLYTLLTQTRELNMIKTKFLLIMKIKKADDIDKELKNWDLWGPFGICLLLSLSLYWKNKTSSAHSIFSTIFFLTSLGAFGITLNAKLLGSKQYSFFDQDLSSKTSAWWATALGLSSWAVSPWPSDSGTLSPS